MVSIILKITAWNIGSLIYSTWTTIYFGQMHLTTAGHGGQKQQFFQANYMLRNNTDGYVVHVAWKVEDMKN